MTRPALTPAEIGDTIHEIGAAWHDHAISRADAVERIRGADPTLTEQGAAAQLTAWRTAPTRYRADTGLTDLDQRRPGTAADLRGEPITFRFPPPT